MSPLPDRSGTASAARTMLRGLLELLYPNACWVCGDHTAPRAVPLVCDACAGALTRDPHPTCPRCSSSVGPYTALDRGCPACRDEAFAFDGVLRLGPYEGLLRDTILRLKGPAGEGLAEAVGALWARKLAPRLGDRGIAAVVPVPLHWWRRWRRGFNQSETLAHAVACELGVPCRTGWLRCVRRTGHQKGLPPTARRQNVRGAYRAAVAADLTGKAVLLVDDVLTTGATASEAAKALRTLHPSQILVAVLAHGR